MRKLKHPRLAGPIPKIQVFVSNPLSPQWCWILANTENKLLFKVFSVLGPIWNTIQPDFSLCIFATFSGIAGMKTLIHCRGNGDEVWKKRLASSTGAEVGREGGCWASPGLGGVKPTASGSAMSLGSLSGFFCKPSLILHSLLLSSLCYFLSLSYYNKWTRKGLQIGRTPRGRKIELTGSSCGDLNSFVNLY